MRTILAFLILTMVASCGGSSGPMLHPKDAAAGGTQSSGGGAAVSTSASLAGGNTAGADGGTPQGGTTDTGGTPTAGGIAGAGGASTSASSSGGGSVATGGKSTSGGTTSTSGSTPGGGTTGLGGSSSKGGAPGGAGGTSTTGSGSAGTTTTGGTTSAGGMNSGGSITARGGSTGTGGAGTGGVATGGVATGGVATGGNSSGTTSTGGRAGGATGHAACQTDADCTGANLGYKCCNNLCSNTANDILNCGGCGITCTGADPYCNNGTCGAPPCQGASCGSDTRCCGSQCCGAGKLCCVVNMGPSVLGCFDPVDGTCPPGCATCVCASPDTPIATPTGNRTIASLRVGDLVFSEHEGALVAVPLIKVAHRPAAGHLVVHLVTARGSVLNISGPHPTADGRRFADLKVGDLLDGDTIIVRELQAYPHAFTYDILPASSTGTYVADGLLIGSTLK